MYAKTVTLGGTHWEQTNEIMFRNRRIGCRYVFVDPSPHAVRSMFVPLFVVFSALVFSGKIVFSRSRVAALLRCCLALF